MPTISFLSKKSLKLFLGLTPVSFLSPFSNIALTTSGCTLPSLWTPGSVTWTTRPGKGPGSECSVLGIFSASSMLVLGRAGGCGFCASCAQVVGVPSSRPIPAPSFSRSRRLISALLSIDLYFVFRIVLLSSGVQLIVQKNRHYSKKKSSASENIGPAVRSCRHRPLCGHKKAGPVGPGFYCDTGDDDTPALSLRSPALKSPAVSRRTELLFI